MSQECRQAEITNEACKHMIQNIMFCPYFSRGGREKCALHIEAVHTCICEGANNVIHALDHLQNTVESTREEMTSSSI